MKRRSRSRATGLPVTWDLERKTSIKQGWLSDVQATWELEDVHEKKISALKEQWNQYLVTKNIWRMATRQSQCTVKNEWQKKKDKDAVRRPCGVVVVDILVRSHRVEMRVSEKCKPLEGKGTGRRRGGG